MKLTNDQLRVMLQGIDLIRGVIIEAIGNEVTPVEPTTTVVNNVVNIDTKKPVGTETEATEDTTDLENLAYNDIKALCKEYGISVKGSKAVLIEQLKAVLEGAQAEPEIEPEVEIEEEPEVEIEIDEEPEVEVETGTDMIIGDNLEDQLSLMSVEELTEILDQAGIQPKGKKQTLIAKILKAVEEGIIEFGTEEESEDEDTTEIPGEEESAYSLEEIEEFLSDLDIKTLKLIAKELDIKVSLKDKHKDLGAKIITKEVEDIINTLISLDLIDDPESEEEEVVVDKYTDTTFVPVGTPIRQEKVLELFESYNQQYTEGSYSDKEVLSFLKEYYNENPEELDTKLPKEELANMYAWIHANLIDDEGNEVDFNEPYEVDGAYWNCSKPLEQLDNGDFYCTVTGETYEG